MVSVWVELFEATNVVFARRSDGVALDRGTSLILLRRAHFVHRVGGNEHIELDLVAGDALEGALHRPALEGAEVDDCLEARWQIVRQTRGQLAAIVLAQPIANDVLDNARSDASALLPVRPVAAIDQHNAILVIAAKRVQQVLDNVRADEAIAAKYQY